MAGKNQSTQEQDINQLLKVRRDKLKELQESGRDPFQITKYDVTHHSLDIKDNFDSLEGKQVLEFGSWQNYVEACDGKGVILQYPGFERRHSVLCSQG